MLRHALLVLGPLVLITGCSGSVSVGNTLDAEKLESEVSKAVRVQAGVPVKSVECPTGVKYEKGGNFECAVTAKDGTTGNVQVTQTDDKGNVHFNAPFIHIDEAEAAIVEQIKKQVKDADDATVDCPDIVVVKSGAPFECSGSTGGKSFTVDATQTDDHGHFTFRAK